MLLKFRFLRSLIQVEAHLNLRRFVESKNYSTKIQHSHSHALKCWLNDENLESDISEKVTQIWRTPSSQKMSAIEKWFENLNLATKNTQTRSFDPITPFFDRVINLDSLISCFCRVCDVYQLICQNCPFIYIGQTGRSLKIKIAEHLRNSEKSHFCAQLKRVLIIIHSDPSSRLLHLGGKGIRLTALEAVEIIRAKNNTDVRVLNEEIPSLYLAEKYYHYTSEIFKLHKCSQTPITSTHWL